MSDNNTNNQMQQSAEVTHAAPAAGEAAAAAASPAAAPSGADSAAEPKAKAKAGRPKKAKAADDDEDDAADADAAAAAAAAVSAGTSLRGRERKVTQAYVPPSPVKRGDVDEEVVESGKGTPLGEIASIKHHIDTTQAQEAEMKALYVACFPHMRANVTKVLIKKRIRAFSGYVLVKEHAELAEEKLQRFDTATLKAVAHMLEIGESGTKAKLIERIIDFLKEPSSSGSGKSSSSSGTKRKSSGSSKAAKDGKPKRAATSFMLFSGANRDKIKADDPSMDMKSIAIRLGEMWRALSDAKRAEWKERAEALKSGGSGSASEGESDEEEAAPAVKKPKKEKKAKESSGSSEVALSDEWRGKFTKSIEFILQGANLADLSLAKVRQQLVTEHGDLVVEANKDAIKQLTLQLINAQTSK